MFYSKDPKVLREQIASQVREWYETHHESWWERIGGPPDASEDTFIIELVHEVLRLADEARAQLEKQTAPAGSTLKEAPIKGRKKARRGTKTP